MEADTPSQLSGNESPTTKVGAAVSRRAGAVFDPEVDEPLVATHKRCSRCSRWLPLEAFPGNRRMKAGRSSWCRECHREAVRDWRREHPEEIEASNAARRLPPLREARICSECSKPFTARRRRGTAPLTCSPACRRRRKSRIGRARRAAA